MTRRPTLRRAPVNPTRARRAPGPGLGVRNRRKPGPCFQAGVLVVACAVGLGCARPQHIRPHTPRERDFQAGDYQSAPQPVSEGSLWHDSSVSLFADFRATRVGDLVTIRIDESPRAAGDARTDLEREQSASFGASSFFGLTSALQQAYPNIDPSSLIDIASRSSFLGDGETQRGSRVRGEIAVRVKQVMPNGDLYVEGTKVILVNEEELHIYVSGVVRPQDIQEDNSVRSGLIADAQVEFTGRGTLTDNQRQGWLARLISALVP